MSMVIKGFLQEELLNSLEMERLYKEKLAELPKGSLVIKKRGNSSYYYLQFRQGDKVKSVYKGNNLREETISKYKKAKDLRKKYRSHLSEVRQQIKYLRGVLRG